MDYAITPSSIESDAFSSQGNVGSANYIDKPNKDHVYFSINVNYFHLFGEYSYGKCSDAK